MKSKLKETGEYILICPRCGSTNISPHGKEPGVYDREAAETFRVHVCDGCEYTGIFFPEVPLKKLKAIQREISEYRKKKA